jgi:hypothetical protein
MPAPITHIVLAEKIFEKYFAGMNREEFLLGTSFPDIRRMGNFERGKTHLQKICFADLQDESSFMAGFKLHSLVDKTMDRYREETGLYSLFSSLEYQDPSMKVFADMVLYDKVKNWGEIIKVFEKMADEELKFGVGKEVVEKWHAKLMAYFAHKPEKVEYIRKLIWEPVEVSEEIVRTIETVSDREKAVKLVEDYYDNFEEIIKRACI